MMINLCFMTDSSWNNSSTLLILATSWTAPAASLQTSGKGCVSIIVLSEEVGAEVETFEAEDSANEELLTGKASEVRNCWYSSCPFGLCALKASFAAFFITFLCTWYVVPSSIVLPVSCSLHRHVSLNVPPSLCLRPVRSFKRPCEGETYEQACCPPIKSLLVRPVFHMKGPTT